jgi:hypothetical protein
MRSSMANTRPARSGLAVSLLVLACSSVVYSYQGVASPGPLARPAAPIQSTLPSIVVNFKDIAEQAGLTAVNVSGGADKKDYILETTGDGVAIFDYDDDGWMDILLVNATTLDGQGRGATSTSHLYHNLGNMHFENVTAKAGLGKVGWGQGVCAADYDNDGHTDLFITYYGHSVLYHNEGNGTFKDVTDSAGLRSDSVRFVGTQGVLSLTMTSMANLIWSSPDTLISMRAKFPHRAPADTASGKAFPSCAVREVFQPDAIFSFTMMVRENLPISLSPAVSVRLPAATRSPRCPRTSIMTAILICTSPVILGRACCTTT